MLTGRWADELHDARGARIGASPWRHNLVVDTAFPLVAGLLKRELELDGILYWALGSGRSDWDEDPPAPAPRATNLATEIHREVVPIDAIEYLNETGATSSTPTTQLEIRMTFEWPDEDVTLREFGMFGGAAEDAPNSGILINYVIHPRLELEQGSRLTRRLRLTVGRAAERRWVELPAHWLGELPVLIVDGVGDTYTEVLNALGVMSVEMLARGEASVEDEAIPLFRRLEFRSKARLAMSTAAEIRAPLALQRMTVGDVLRESTASITERTGMARDDVSRLRDQLATLELALDHRFLSRLTVGALAGAGP